MKVDQLNRLAFWITEREAIRRKKDASEPPPWTTDQILAEWRFCNVDRCDDRETRWIFEHVIAAHADSPVLWFNLTIARLINWSPALARIGYFEQWEPERFVATIETLQREGAKVYTGAYMIPASAERGRAKHLFLAHDVLTPLWELRRRAPHGGICFDWSAFLRRVPCMGDFLRNQVITDMKYSHHLPRASTADWTVFVLAGPGTQRGLNRLHGRPLTAPWRDGEAPLALIALRDELRARSVLPERPAIFDDLNNLSNCMCEFDKYERVRLGEGTPRARYVYPSADKLGFVRFGSRRWRGSSAFGAAPLHIRRRERNGRSIMRLEASEAYLNGVLPSAPLAGADLDAFVAPWVGERFSGETDDELRLRALRTVRGDLWHGEGAGDS